MAWSAGRPKTPCHAIKSGRGGGGILSAHHCLKVWERIWRDRKEYDPAFQSSRKYHRKRWKVFCIDATISPNICNTSIKDWKRVAMSIAAERRIWRRAGLQARTLAPILLLELLKLTISLESLDNSINLNSRILWYGPRLVTEFLCQIVEERGALRPRIWEQVQCQVQCFRWTGISASSPPLTRNKDDLPWRDSSMA